MRLRDEAAMLAASLAANSQTPSSTSSTPRTTPPGTTSSFSGGGGRRAARGSARRACRAIAQPDFGEGDIIDDDSDAEADSPAPWGEGDSNLWISAIWKVAAVCTTHHHNFNGSSNQATFFAKILIGTPIDNFHLA